MFTNWLTNTNAIMNQQSVNSINYNINHPMDNLGEGIITPSLIVNNANHLNSNIMTQPPDVILEIGQRPTSARFIAHSIVLSSHSGYLRSAIRLDERPPNSKAELVVYLNNVTPEQFGPLLTYMYTGYLDLNLENIFAVLLATHVLHMPQALEVCRSFLLQAQCEGYLPPVGINDITANTFPNYSSATTNRSQRKILRPIASKPTVGNYFFSPFTHAGGHSVLSSTPLLTQIMQRTPSTSTSSTSALADSTKLNGSIQVEKPVETKPTLDSSNVRPVEDDEDEEVFIDSTSSDLDMTKIDIQNSNHKKNPISLSSSTTINNNNNNKNNIKGVNRNVIKIQKSDKINRKSELDRPSNKHQRHKHRRKSVSSTISTGVELQIAKAPILASQLDANDPNKVIIDIASCDGPVRFKRILNTSYGYKPNANCNSPYPNPSTTTDKYSAEKAQKNVSISFQQQMARTISEKCQQFQQVEESENSETSSNCSNKLLASNCKILNNELYVCVYCKHTFKSQYCYQKHAKRHLNPISLQKAEPIEASGSLQIDNTTKHRTSNTNKTTTSTLCTTANERSNVTLITSRVSQSSGQAAATEETKPPFIDMNVQYYPCKTCGCKFPSYYFVHKHRKMCHVDEETEQATPAAAAAGTEGTQDLKDITHPTASATTTAIMAGNTTNCTTANPPPPTPSTPTPNNVPKNSNYEIIN